MIIQQCVPRSRYVYVCEYVGGCDIFCSRINLQRDAADASRVVKSKIIGTDKLIEKLVADSRVSGGHTRVCDVCACGGTSHCIA